MSFSIPAPSSGVAVLASFGRSWHSHIPLGLLFNFQGTVRRSFTYSHWEAASGKSKSEKYLRIWKVLSPVPTGKSKIIGCFWKIFCLQKILSLIWTKGVEMHTHFWDFPRQIFYLPKISPHLFGITKPNDTLFHRKNEKIFFCCGCFILLASKNPFTYFHWKQTNAHPKSQKIFYPFTYLELRSRNAPCFYRNFEKYFFRLRALILLDQKIPSLIPTENSQMHPLNLKKFLSFHLFGIGMPKRNLFFRKNRKIFLKRLSISKTSPHLFPLGKGVWGQWFWKKAKKFARREWRAEI